MRIHTAPRQPHRSVRGNQPRSQEHVVAKELSQAQLRELALVGARARLEELQRQEAELRAAFPELFRRGGGRKRVAAAAAGAGAPKRRRRSRMSAAARRAVSERMTKYWAERREEQTQKAGK
jgi:hypothetical protein